MTDQAIAHDSRAIANRILDVAAGRQISLTIMQLVKLIYFAHGWNLAIRGEPLSKHSAQAWQYGPVFPHVYKVLQSSRSRPIDGRILSKETGKPLVEEFDQQERDLIDEVVDGYGRMHAFQLSNLTHGEGTPWDKTMKTTGIYSEIKNDLIREYFSQMTNARQN